MGQPVGPARHLGMAFFIGSNGEIATCKHVIQSIKSGEMFLANSISRDQKSSFVFNIKTHRKYDFATAQVDWKDTQAIPLSKAEQPYIGDDIVAFGATSFGVIAGEIQIHLRLFKGYIVRTHHTPILSDAKSTCEVSFPSLSGFSGTPLISQGKEESVAGMLFSNYESTIQIHKNISIKDDGNEYSEEIHKVIELGVAHKAKDIQEFIQDMEDQPFEAYI
jgi:hypothetical protein